MSKRLAVSALPFLVAIAPILHLWSQNTDAVGFASARGPLALALVVAALSLVIAWVVTRNMVSASTTVAVILALALTFGHRVDALPWDPRTSRWVVLGVDLVAAIAVIALTIRARHLLARVAIASAVVLLLFNLLSIPAIAAGWRSEISRVEPGPTPDTTMPDIYYIVLDGYGRGDVLAELYGYDNEPFLDELRERGFYIANGSAANYSRTNLSLASSLNMRYMDADADTTQLIQSSEVVTRLRAGGYRYVHVTSPWGPTHRAPLADAQYGRQALDDFATTFLETTVVGRFTEPTGIHEYHLAALRAIAEVSQIDAATFTVAHIVLPHPPFVFDARGNVISYAVDLSAGSEDPDAYIEQLIYTNTRIVELVDVLTADSDQRPVIIVQGDHGPDTFISRGIKDGAELSATDYWERMANLNAYLVPDSARATLYQSITPVNSFRILLASLLGDDLPLLDDRSWFTWYEGAPGGAGYLDLIEVTDLIRGRASPEDGSHSVHDEGLVDLGQ